MTASQITSIINALPNTKYIYGFRLSSGKEIILAKVNSSEEAIEYKDDESANPDKFVIKAELLKIEGRGSSPIGQSKVCRIVAISDIVEVLVLYNPKIDGELNTFAGV